MSSVLLLFELDHVGKCLAELINRLPSSVLPNLARIAEDYRLV
jgi:hypothetical protein